MEIKVMEFTACRLLLLFRVAVLACFLWLITPNTLKN